MKTAGTGLLTRQEYRSHLNGLCAKSQRGDYTACVAYAARGDHRHINDVDDLRDERERARKRSLRGPEECTTMSSGFEPGSDYRIHACLLKCCCLIGGCRRANRDDAPRPA